jgi:hypothetical protein
MHAASHASSHSTKAGETESASTEAEIVLLAEEFISGPSALALLSVISLFLFLHPRAAESEPTSHEIVVIEEISERISPPEEVSKYVLRMMHVEVAVAESGPPEVRAAR